MIDKSKFLQCLPNGERTISSDFQLFSNTESYQDLDYLGFFDSRATKTKDENVEDSFARKLSLDLAKKHKKYLIVARPYNATTFFSLINFLKSFEVHTKLLTTNMGFVDLTPKKIDIIQDISDQALIASKEFIFSPTFIGKTVSLEGVDIQLYSLDIGQYAASITDILIQRCEHIILLKTHEISPQTSLQRARPDCFYTQLVETNIFLKKLKDFSPEKIDLIDIPLTDSSITNSLYDGVHYTDNQHDLIFQLLAKG